MQTKKSRGLGTMGAKRFWPHKRMSENEWEWQHYPYAERERAEPGV